MNEDGSVCEFINEWNYGKEENLWVILSNKYHKNTTTSFILFQESVHYLLPVTSLLLRLIHQKWQRIWHLQNFSLSIFSLLWHDSYDHAFTRTCTNTLNNIPRRTEEHSRDEIPLNDMRRLLSMDVNKVRDFHKMWFLLSHLLIDRHLEHLIIFDGLETEYESSVKLLSGVAPEGGLVPVGEVNAAAAARMEHSDSTSSSPSVESQLHVISSTSS